MVSANPSASPASNRRAPLPEMYQSATLAHSSQGGAGVQQSFEQPAHYDTWSQVADVRLESDQHKLASSSFESSEELMSHYSHAYQGSAFSTQGKQVSGQGQREASTHQPSVSTTSQDPSVLEYSQLPPSRYEAGSGQGAHASKSPPLRLSGTFAHPHSTPQHFGRDGPDLTGLASMPMSALPRSGTDGPEGGADRIKQLEEVVHCFWLVSEDRMSQVQETLRTMSAQQRSTQYEQEQMSLQLAQVVPLQVEITQKTVGAADERKLIFSRIKALEESVTMQHEEVRAKLDVMQAELRSSLAALLEAAPKGRKTTPQKAASNGAATRGSKGGSPTSKKATSSAANTKKRKSQALDGDEDDHAASAQAPIMPSPTQRPQSAPSPPREALPQYPTYSQLQPVTHTPTMSSAYMGAFQNGSGFSS